MLGLTFVLISCSVVLAEDHKIVRRQSDQRPMDPQTVPVAEALRTFKLTASAKRQRKYPTYTETTRTSFDCLQVGGAGYFADPEMDCQQYHRCTESGRKSTFLCPPGTLFNQLTLVCDFYYNVDCSQVSRYYEYANSRMYHGEGVHLLDTVKTPESYTNPYLARLALGLGTFKSPWRREPSSSSVSSTAKSTQGSVSSSSMTGSGSGAGGSSSVQSGTENSGEMVAAGSDQLVDVSQQNLDVSSMSDSSGGGRFGRVNWRPPAPKNSELPTQGGSSLKRVTANTAQNGGMTMTSNIGAGNAGGMLSQNSTSKQLSMSASQPANTGEMVDNNGGSGVGSQSSSGSAGELAANASSMGAAHSHAVAVGGATQSQGTSSWQSNTGNGQNAVTGAPRKGPGSSGRHRGRKANFSLQASGAPVAGQTGSMIMSSSGNSAGQMIGAASGSGQAGDSSQSQMTIKAISDGPVSSQGALKQKLMNTNVFASGTTVTSGALKVVIPPPRSDGARLSAGPNVQQSAVSGGNSATSSPATGKPSNVSPIQVRVMTACDKAANIEFDGTAMYDAMMASVRSPDPASANQSAVVLVSALPQDQSSANDPYAAMFNSVWDPIPAGSDSTAAVATSQVKFDDAYYIYESADKPVFVKFAKYNVVIELRPDLTQ